MTTSSSTVIVVSACATAVVVVSSLSAVTMAYRWHKRCVEKLQRQWQERRQEERVGRIRAEVRLRTLLKQQQQQRQPNTSSTTSAAATAQDDGNDNDDNNDAAVPRSRMTMTMKCIGTVTSPYTKRIGTPRQPQLVPSSRGYITFTGVPSASLCGIDAYSHVWIIFAFHANTNIVDDNSSSNKKKTKIRPPRAPGKVGQLASRSPHRPNPVGLSLVKVEAWKERERRLHVSGLDLVHGTPVYDIKPCVPWDIPGYNHDNNSGSSSGSVHNTVALRVPEWVDQADAIATVHFTPEANASLQNMVHEGRLGPLYTAANDGYAAARQTLQEILAQDPRSSHKGLKENARGTTNADACYSLVFGRCVVEFMVDKEDASSSSPPSSMRVTVCAVSPVDFDPESYVDGIPLVSESNNNNDRNCA